MLQLKEIFWDFGSNIKNTNKVMLHFQQMGLNSSFFVCHAYSIWKYLKSCYFIQTWHWNPKSKKIIWTLGQEWKILVKYLVHILEWIGVIVLGYESIAIVGLKFLCENFLSLCKFQIKGEIQYGK